MKNKNIDLLDIATIFARRKTTFLKIIGVATVLGIIVAFIWPKSYKTDITFVVTDGNAINLSVDGLLSSFTGMATGRNSISADQALVIIRSTAIYDQIIKKFNLEEVLGADIPEALRKKLDGKIEVDDKREGGIGFNNIIAIDIAYSDKEPQRSYELVQYYYHLLDSTIQALNRQSASESFYLIKNRLDQNIRDLQTAEDSLVAFQTRHGILEVEEQARAQIKAIAELRTEIVRLEIQLEYLVNIVGEQHTNVSNLKAQIDALEKRYNRLIKGNDNYGEFDIFQTAEELPALFIEYLRRYREVMVQEEIYKVLYPQFEQQKLNFEESTSGLLIIDPPVLPTYKDSPKRAYIIIAAFMFGLFLAVIVVLYKEWREDLIANHPQEYQRYKAFAHALRFKDD